MPTAPTILAGLVAAVKTITVANGYATDLDPNNVFTVLDSLNQQVQPEAAAYPRMFVLSDGADYSGMPSHTILKNEKFTVIGVFAKNETISGDVPLATQVSNFINDFEVMIDRNQQLGGSDLVTIEKCATDIGTSDPEAVCVFEINIQYRRRFS